MANQYPGVVERLHTGGGQFLLPQSTPEDWKARRRDEFSRYLGDVPDNPDIEEEIGPHQVEGDRLWFGKSFYNGEGVTGIGGFGYFDADARSYKLYAPPAIWPWSVSALLLQPDALWLGLTQLRRRIGCIRRPFTLGPNQPRGTTH